MTAEIVQRPLDKDDAGIYVQIVKQRFFEVFHAVTVVVQGDDDGEGQADQQPEKQSQPSEQIDEEGEYDQDPPDKYD